MAWDGIVRVGLAWCMRASTSIHEHTLLHVRVEDTNVPDMCLTSILKDGLASGGPMAMAIGFDGQHADAHQVGDGQVHPSCFGINVGSLHALKKTGCVITQRALACRKHVNVRDGSPNLLYLDST